MDRVTSVIPRVDTTRSARVRWGLGDAALGIALFYLASIAVTLAVVALRDGDASTQLDGWGIGLIMTINAAVFAGVPIVTSRVKGTGSLAADFGFSFRLGDLPRGVAGGFAAAILGATAGALMATFLGQELASNTTDAYEVRGIGQWAAMHLTIGLAVPVAEELFFRGLVLRSFCRRHSVPLGVLASTSLFALLHMGTTGPALPTIAATFVAGIIYAGLTVGRDMRLGAAIVAHVAMNQAALLTLWGA
jgi:membrane protease YdiL (CAAX protease family)